MQRHVQALLAWAVVPGEVRAVLRSGVNADLLAFLPS
jgi:hypothetical protein